MLEEKINTILSSRIEFEKHIGKYEDAISALRFAFIANDTSNQESVNRIIDVFFDGLNELSPSPTQQQRPSLASIQEITRPLKKLVGEAEEMKRVSKDELNDWVIDRNEKLKEVHGINQTDHNRCAYIINSTLGLLRDLMKRLDSVRPNSGAVVEELKVSHAEKLTKISQELEQLKAEQAELVKERKHAKKTKDIKESSRREDAKLETSLGLNARHESTPQTREDTDTTEHTRAAIIRGHKMELRKQRQHSTEERVKACGGCLKPRGQGKRTVRMVLPMRMAHRRRQPSDGTGHGQEVDTNVEIAQ